MKLIETAESGLGRDSVWLQIRKIEVSMVIVEIWLLMVLDSWLLKMNTSLLLWFMCPQGLYTRMMVNFYWLSYLWFVLSSAQSTWYTNHMASFEWWITKKTWQKERKNCYCDPTFRARYIIVWSSITRAWMSCYITFRVTHAMVQHSARTFHHWNCFNSTFEPIWRQCTRTFAVPFFLIKSIAVSKNKIISLNEVQNLKTESRTHRHRRRALITCWGSFMIDSVTSWATRFFKLPVDSRLNLEAVSGSSGKVKLPKSLTAAIWI